MAIHDIPVRVVGPGSQSAGLGEGPSYIDMPSEMQQYDPPLIPEPEDVQHLAGAKEAMAWLESALYNYHVSQEMQLANLNQIDDASRELINQILGEGEVSINFSGTPKAQVQESILAGVWRTVYYDENDEMAIDLLEIAAVPHVVFAANDEQRSIDLANCATATDVPNALPILAELDDRARLFAANGNTHSINLTLLPLSQTELEYLDTFLGRGPVDILSRAYGKCEVISTLTPNIWWVRYFNSMGTLILNTIEITSVPQVVAAADEDISDSAVRLSEMLLSYWPKTA